MSKRRSKQTLSRNSLDTGATEINIVRKNLPGFKEQLENFETEEPLTVEKVEGILRTAFGKLDTSNEIIIHVNTTCQGWKTVNTLTLEAPIMCDNCNCGVRNFYDELNRQANELKAD